MSFKNLHIALVTDWLTNIGGAEKVLRAVSDIFPQAPIFTTVVNRGNIGELADRDIRTSVLQRIPVLNKKHQFLLPLLPKAIESLDLGGYDLVISFSSSVAKSVITTPEQMHICYIHSPMRYAWEPDFDDRFKRFPKIIKPAINLLLKKLRKWDYETRNRPDLYIANSTTTQARVKKYYGKEAEVLYPPVGVEDFQVCTPPPSVLALLDISPHIVGGENEKRCDYYVGIGRMVSYKKFDLLVQTFEKLSQKKLVLIGTGSEEKELKKMAAGCANIVFKGRVSFDELKEYLSNAKALILPQKEDAGIVQLEAFASGVPVIAYKAGGVLDVLEDGKNGVFFEEQKPESLMGAIERFEEMQWDPEVVRESVLGYDTGEFQRKFVKIIEKFIKA